MAMTEKSRSLKKTLSGTHSIIYDPEVFPLLEDTSLSQSWAYNGSQFTASEGHNWSSRDRKNDLTDVGGEFFTVKTEMVNSPQGFHGVAPHAFGVTTDVSGFVTPGITLDDPRIYPAPLNSSREQMYGYGATAISRCLPTNSVATSYEAGGELLKDGIPDLPVIHSLKRRTEILRDAGSEFLNLAYGWLPLKRDVTAIADGVRQFDDLMRKLESRSGKPHRAHYRFATVTDHSEEVVEPSRCNINFGGYHEFEDDGVGKMIISSKKTYDRWFNGSFTYFLPKDYSRSDEFSRHVTSAKKIFGVELTPELIWNLTPWSWAADWFSNAGDVIHNLSAFAENGLIMHYGYIMETTVHEVTVGHLGPTGLKSVPTVGPLQFRTTTKSRYRAEPYGFGVSWDGLSSFQLSILAALGISRRR